MVFSNSLLIVVSAAIGIANTVVAAPSAFDPTVVLDVCGPVKSDSSECVVRDVSSITIPKDVVCALYGEPTCTSNTDQVSGAPGSTDDVFPFPIVAYLCNKFIPDNNGTAPPPFDPTVIVNVCGPITSDSSQCVVTNVTSVTVPNDVICAFYAGPTCTSNDPDKQVDVSPGNTKDNFPFPVVAYTCNKFIPDNNATSAA